MLKDYPQAEALKAKKSDRRRGLGLLWIIIWASLLAQHPKRYVYISKVIVIDLNLTSNRKKV